MQPGHGEEKNELCSGLLSVSSVSWRQNTIAERGKVLDQSPIFKWIGLLKVAFYHRLMQE